MDPGVRVCGVCPQTEVLSLLPFAQALEQRWGRELGLSSLHIACLPVPADGGEVCACPFELSPNSSWDFLVFEEETEAAWGSASLSEISSIRAWALTSYPEPCLVYRDWDLAQLSSWWVDFLPGGGVGYQCLSSGGLWGCSEQSLAGNAF